MKNELRKVFLNKLPNVLTLTDFVYSWDNSYSKILNCFLEEGVLSHEDIEKVLHEGLLQAGRQCFIQHLKAGIYPDHVISPQSLAYALDHNEFATEEEKQIQFDGETKEEFIQRYGKDILKKIIQFLQTEQKPSVSSISDESDCGGCGYCSH